MSQKQTAVVDAKNIYLGMFEEGAELPAGALRIPEITECDLEPGRYRWQGDSFVPVRRDAEGRLQESPDMIHAIYDGFGALERQGFDFPPSTKEWMRWYATTFDNNIRATGK